MKYRYQNLILFFCFSICQCALSQSIRHNSSFNPSFDLMSMKNDSLDNWTVHIFGKNAHYARYRLLENHYLSGTVYDKNKGHCAAFVIQRHFYIPLHSDSMQLDFSGMVYGQKPYNVYLIVKQYGRGKLVQTDNIVLTESEVVQVYRKGIKLVDKASDAIISIESYKPCGFLFDKMDIKIDGISIQDIEFEKTSTNSKKGKNGLLSLVSDTINIPNSATIVGIGESIHGSKTLNQERNNLVLNAIRNRQLDVLLLEVQAFVGIILNRYVTYVDDTLDIEIDNTNTGYFSNENFKTLINEIRKINKTRATPIQIVGVDILSGPPAFAMGFKYNLKHFRDSMLTSDNPLIKLTSKNRKDSTLLKSATDDNMIDRIFWSQYSISQLDNLNLAFSDPIDFSYRDYMMFVNTQRIIDHFGENKKYMLYAHLGHLIKDSEYGQSGNAKPMGYYLANQYGKKYFLIGEFALNGKTLLKRYSSGYEFVNKDSVYQMDLPLDHSLESVCSGISEESFYISNWKDSKWTNEVWRCRFIGNYRCDVEFHPFNMDDIDAAFITKRSEPIGDK